MVILEPCLSTLFFLYLISLYVWRVSHKINKFHGSMCLSSLFVPFTCTRTIIIIQPYRPILLQLTKATFKSSINWIIVLLYYTHLFSIQTTCMSEHMPPSLLPPFILCSLQGNSSWHLCHDNKHLRSSCRAPIVSIETISDSSAHLINTFHEHCKYINKSVNKCSNMEQ